MDKIYVNYIKRFLDIIFAIIGIVVLSPIYLILILVLFIMQGRPIFFSQKRVGLNGKIFKMYKFRTMMLSREHLDFNLTTINKITKIGQFLRITSLDELPQLLNILKGNMSFIGPRPWIPEIYEYLPYEAKRRLNVLPGLSGHAQVNGRNGISINEKIKLDLIYIDNVCLRVDMNIFFKTIKCIFSYKHADITEQDLIKEIKNLQPQSCKES